MANFSVETVPGGIGGGFKSVGESSIRCSCGGVGLCSCGRVGGRLVSERETEAAMVIQRYYHSYRLRKIIEELRESDPWFFVWKVGENGDMMDVDSDEEEEVEEDDEEEEQKEREQKREKKLISDDSRLPSELQFNRLQSKFQDARFFSNICQFLELLGSAKTAVKCHSKLLLMAFMLNHHRALVGAGVSVEDMNMNIDTDEVASNDGLSVLENKVFPGTPGMPGTPGGTPPPSGLGTPPPAPPPTQQTARKSKSTPQPTNTSALWGSDSSRRKIERSQCAKICNAKCSKSLLRQIARLGSAFISLCEIPTCWFRRMEFMVAYSQFAKSFLNWKSKDALYLIKTQVELFVDVFTTMNDMNQKIKDGQLSLESCQTSLYRLKKTSEYHFLQISKLLGSSKQAKECVQKELSKHRFLRELSKRLDKKKLVYVKWESKMAVKNQVRMAFMQSMVEKCPIPPRTKSREEVYDSNILTLWHGRYYKKLSLIKRTLRDNFRSDEPNNQQKLWLPQLVSYLKGIISEVIIQDEEQLKQFVQPLDTEFLTQQCAFNNCDPKEYLIYFVEFLKKYSNSTRYAKLCNILATLQKPPQPITLDLLLDIITLVDDLRVDITQVGLQSVIAPILNEDAKKNELVALVHDFNSHKSDISRLEQWVEQASNDTNGLISSFTTLPSTATATSTPIPFSRLEKLMIYFVSEMTNFPDSAKLDNIPETFAMLRLPILHMQMLIRDTVMTFAIVHFTLSVSKDDSYICRLKSSIQSVLKEDSKLTRTELNTKICNLIDYERPTLTSSERTLLHGLISRLLMPISSVLLVTNTKQNTSFSSPKDNALWAVPRLALDRIRKANDHKLLHPRDTIPEPQRTLNHFDCEVKQISQYMSSIWKLSLGTYKPVYETIINSKHFWRKPAPPL